MTPLKPNFPNPGQGRYWDVARDQAGDFTLTLRGPVGGRIVEVSIYRDDISKEMLEQFAHTLLARVANEELFVGSYTFEENI